LSRIPFSELELKSIARILQDNHFHNQQITAGLQNLKQAHNQAKDQDTPGNKKWALVTYSHKDVKTITKLLKPANINTAFKTRNTIRKILGIRQQAAMYEDSGVY
jgi:ferritin